ncbi:MAG TPA: methionine adenosyltransferase [Candidatus Nitrosotenuis sp.]|nr:methionine adenosyltransferase [Candidatus Nitrosotenuis sp.]
MRTYDLFTSESVTEGHPDKVADMISDAILDAYLAQDPRARVACETFVHTGCVHVAGQITSEAVVDLSTVVRSTLLEIGYTDPAYGIDGRSCGILLSIDRQSADIAMGVDRALEVRGREQAREEETLGAGDQGMMFGYACTETPELMPMPIVVAHRLARRLAEVRKHGILSYLRPDGKTQVTVRYREGRPAGLENVVVSAQHNPDVTLEQIRRDIIEHVIRPVLVEYRLDLPASIFVNPTGRFVTGGPEGDTGLTGRKIIVDTYGGMARHGGGAFSGKDPTKVDRSANYAARWVAKNVVAAGLADQCEVAIAYAIGVAHPVSIAVETFGTHRVPPERISQLIREHFDLRPGAIIRDLELRRPVYKSMAAYGHFGRENASWERTDHAQTLRQAAGLSENSRVAVP